MPSTAVKQAAISRFQSLRGFGGCVMRLPAMNGAYCPAGFQSLRGFGVCVMLTSCA